MYNNKTITASLIALTITIIFGLLYLLIHIKAEQKDYSTFEAVTGIVGLIVAIISAVYVYNAYTTQKELIAIQRKEIEDNRKDTEFNRAVDLVFKQLEHSNIRFAELKKDVADTFKYLDVNEGTDYNLKLIATRGNRMIGILIRIQTELSIFYKIIDTDKIGIDNATVIRNIIYSNFGEGVLESVYELYTFLDFNVDESTKDFGKLYQILEKVVNEENLFREDLIDVGDFRYKQIDLETVKAYLTVMNNFCVSIDQILDGQNPFNI